MQWAASTIAQLNGVVAAVRVHFQVAIATDASVTAKRAGVVNVLFHTRLCSAAVARLALEAMRVCRVAVVNIPRCRAGDGCEDCSRFGHVLAVVRQVCTGQCVRVCTCVWV